MLITSQMIAGSHLSDSTKLSNPPIIKRVIDNAVTHNNMPFSIIMIVFILSLFCSCLAIRVDLIVIRYYFCVHIDIKLLIVAKLVVGM